MQSARDRSLISQFAIAAFALSLIGCSTAAAISNTPAPTRAAARNATGTTTTVAASAAATSAATTVDVQSAAPTHDHTAVAPTAAATEAAATTAPTIAPTSTTTPATPVPTLAPTVAPTAAPPSGPVVVTLVDTAIRLDRTSASSGTVSFQIRNAGSVAHELIVLKTDIPQNQIPVSTTQAATVTVPGLVAQTQILNPGASTTLTLNLASGKYVLMCNQPAHYLIGMHTGFTIN